MTTLYIGTDATAGADIQIRFQGVIAASSFTVASTENGQTLIGLAEGRAAVRVAELAVQIRAAQKANVDVLALVEGHSTTNPHAVENVSQVSGPTRGSHAFDTGESDGVELMGVHPLS